MTICVEYELDLHMRRVCVCGVHVFVCVCMRVFVCTCACERQKSMQANSDERLRRLSVLNTRHCWCAGLCLRVVLFSNERGSVASA